MRKKINWIPLALADKTEDNRITKSGWIKSSNSPVLFQHYYLAEQLNNNRKEARFVQHTIIISILENGVGLRKKIEKEAMKIVKKVADNYEKTGEWPKTKEKVIKYHQLI
mgnify:FL=1